jgi:endonuclease/exonuclease/phosphatase (EEP) superfamily protein YafD
VFSSFNLIRQDTEWGYCDLVSAQLTLTEEFGGGSLRVASVHLSRNSSWQPAVVHAVLSQSARESVVAGGDFNRTPWSWSLRIYDQIRGLDRRTHALPSWPTGARFRDTSLSTPFPVLPIDHIFASVDWRTTDVRRGPEVGSDHYPVIVELTRRP